MWVYPRSPEVVAAPELKNIAKTYGKFWCLGRSTKVSDKLPKGAPELMMTPQGVLRPELVKFRDDKCFALDIMTVEMNRNEQFP
ncbi:hypothetical protein YC2023_083206 [Brassica napus]